VRDERPLELVAERLIAGGIALARHPDGRAVMLTGALPGERVTARVVEEKRDYLRAATDAILVPNADRRDPPCPALARGCGGCDWQHVASGAQLALKAGIVADALRHTARLPDVEVQIGGSVPATAYRTTLRLGVDTDGRPGLRAAGSHTLVPIDACLVAHPELNALLAGLRLPGAREVQLRVGTRTGDRAIRWWPDSLPVPDNLPTGVRTGPHGYVEELVAGVQLRIGSDAFFQSSPEAAELLVAAVQRAAGPPDTWAPGPVVDAYGGVGLFAATVVPAARERIVVESNAVACEDARHNLAPPLHSPPADIAPARVLARPLERWTPKRAGLVIANPARPGLGKAAVRVLAATRAPVLVLVSCDPVAFARDARLLAGEGYRLMGCEVLDLFPQTHHVEVVSRFVRAHYDPTAALAPAVPRPNGA
jgi:23S rRNA (uracil1939-C5)-methyltransferase